MPSPQPSDPADPHAASADVRARQQAAVAVLGVRALHGMRLAQLMDDAVAIVVSELGTEFVKVLEVLPDRHTARLVAGRGWRAGLVGQATVDLDHGSQAGFALASHEPVIVDDLRTETRFADPPLLSEHGVVSGMSVILYGEHDTAYGVLGAHTVRHRRFTHDDISFLQGVANVLSAALQRRAAEDELRRARTEAESYVDQLQAQAVELEQQAEEAQSLAEELEQANEQLRQAAEEAEAARAVAAAAGDRAQRLLAVATGLGGASTPEQVADVVFREGMTAVGADAGSLALLHTLPDGSREFEVVRTHGFAPSVVEEFRRFPLAAGRPLSDAVLDRAPRLIGTHDQWTRDYPSAARAARGYEAFAAVPVVAGDEVLAGLAFSFRTRDPFDAATRTFLATLGEQSGLALARARAFEAERHARESSAFLAEASRVLSASLDYETTLRAVAESAVPVLGDWCAVDMVRDPTVATWPPQLDRLAMVHKDPARLALGTELAERYPTNWSTDVGMALVLRDATPLFIPVITDEMLTAGAVDAEHLRLLRAVEFSSVIVVPLVARGLTLGALTLVMSESGRRFDASDLVLAQDLARRAAIAVDNARLYREAAVAREAAEQANLGKSQFLATMSHELRTPLNAIGGHAQLLELGVHGTLTDPQRDALQRIDRAQRHLLGLINDVLNYARIESGRVEYAVEPIRVADIVRDVQPMVEPQLVAKGLVFDVDVPDDGADPPLLVWADREKLAQVLLNLVSNAVKFTPTGGRVTVTLTTRADDDGAKDVAYLRVTDSGIGIPADKLDAVFEPFVQVDASRTRTQQGTGLGLAISRDLARGMGGDLRVRSKEGQGSAFTVTLRRVVSANGEPLDRRVLDERRLDEERRLEAMRRLAERREA